MGEFLWSSARQTHYPDFINVSNRCWVKSGGSWKKRERKSDSPVWPWSKFVIVSYMAVILSLHCHLCLMFCFLFVFQKAYLWLDNLPFTGHSCSYNLYVRLSSSYIHNWLHLHPHIKRGNKQTPSSRSIFSLLDVSEVVSKRGLW